jgi:hypothetical protein
MPGRVPRRPRAGAFQESMGQAWTILVHGLMLAGGRIQVQQGQQELQVPGREPRCSSSADSCHQGARQREEPQEGGRHDVEQPP